jgi:Na+/melibiose symporter-like transporter
VNEQVITFFAAAAGGMLGAAATLVAVALVLAWNQHRLTEKAKAQVTEQIRAAQAKLQTAQLAILGLATASAAKSAPEPDGPVH